MPRPRRIRRIFFNPRITYFKPAGVMLRHLQENILTKDELEAIRLIDLEQIEQKKVAKQMKISQPTLSRLLTSARKKIAEALVDGKAIKIQGGVYKMAKGRGLGTGRGIGRGLGLGRGAGRGAGRAAGGRGRMGGFAAGPVGYCICPKCSKKVKHKIGIPCYKQKCPKCGIKMIRA